MDFTLQASAAPIDNLPILLAESGDNIFTLGPDLPFQTTCPTI